MPAKSTEQYNTTLAMDKENQPNQATIHSNCHVQSSSVSLSASSEPTSLEDFEFLRKIGAGAFGTVYQVRRKTNGLIYALKMITKERVLSVDCMAEHILYEKKVLESVDSPSVVKLHAVFQTEQYLCLLMDFINGGDLFFHIQGGPLFRKRVIFYGAQIVLALSKIHAAGYIYRDLKPENILIDREGNAVLVDFGLCTPIANPCKSLQCASLEYTAPERLLGQHYNTAVDYWGLGVLLYELMTGVHPFYADDPHELAINITTANIDYSLILEPAAQSLISQLLKLKADDRLCDTQKIKAHPFFKTVNWEQLEKKQVPAPFVPDVDGPEDVCFFDPVFTGQNLSFSDLYAPKQPIPGEEVSLPMHLLSLAFKN
jgi:serine/threonine protein kinase